MSDTTTEKQNVSALSDRKYIDQRVFEISLNNYFDTRGLSINDFKRIANPNVLCDIRQVMSEFGFLAYALDDASEKNLVIRFIEISMKHKIDISTIIRGMFMLGRCSREIFEKRSFNLRDDELKGSFFEKEIIRLKRLSIFDYENWQAFIYVASIFLRTGILEV